MDKRPHPEWHGDEFHGVGGSYTYDPKTGKRERVGPKAVPEPSEAQPADKRSKA